MPATHINRNFTINMTTVRTEEFNAVDAKIARYAKVLAHPARIAILRLLLEKQSCICGDIVDELPLSQSTVSQHLKELKASGLIKGEIEGVKVCYCIDEKEWVVAKKMLNQFFSIEIPSNKCC